MISSVKRHRITFQTAESTVDTSGQPIVTWVNFLTNEPASFKPMGGTESMRGKQLDAGTKGVFNINFRTGLNTQMRIIHNGTSYGISNIDEINGISRYLEIMVKA